MRRKTYIHSAIPINLSSMTTHHGSSVTGFRDECWENGQKLSKTCWKNGQNVVILHWKNG